tara:strand:- start:8 stop:868 length:861 start_codon:yes stop_codon:yes gene_type:complete
MKKYLITLRAYHWTKNILVFAPLFFAHQFDSDSINKATIAFLSFCVVASLIYIINDIRDIKFDKLHSTKSLRPIASGQISQSSVVFLIIILIILSVVLSLNAKSAFTKILFAYFLLAMLYTYLLKKMIYLDLIILTSFYIIRIFAGGVVIDASVTTWLIIFSFLLFLSLALIKRITEVQKYADYDLIEMGKSYTKKNLGMLYKFTKIAQFLALFTLSLYIFISAPDLYSKYLYLILSVVIFYFWFNHVLTTTKNNNMKDDPIIFAIFDPLSYFSFISIIAIFVLAI